MRVNTLGIFLKHLLRPLSGEIDVLPQPKNVTMPRGKTSLNKRSTTEVMVISKDTVQDILSSEEKKHPVTSLAELCSTLLVLEPRWAKAAASWRISTPIQGSAGVSIRRRYNNKDWSRKTNLFVDNSSNINSTHYRTLPKKN